MRYSGIKKKKNRQRIKDYKWLLLGNEARAARALYHVAPRAGKAMRLLFCILFLAENLLGTLWKLSFPT